MGIEKPGPPKRVGQIVERDEDRRIRGDGGTNQGPRGEGGGHAVEDAEESAEERDGDACRAHAEELQAADDDGGEEAEADDGAGLQKQAGEHARGLGLEERGDDGGRFPWAGPVGHTARDW